MELHPFLRKLGFTPEGTMVSREVHPEAIRDAVRADPEAAARFVMGVVGQKSPPSAIGQMAMVVAGAYLLETQDDSLQIAVQTAPWVNDVKLPQFLTPDRKPMPPEPEDPFRPIPGTLRILDVVEKDMLSGDVSGYVRRFSFEPKSAAEKKRMVATWGSWSLSFTTKDERSVLAIPEARRFVSRLHEAMPYFPAYLDQRPDLAMFWVYFGCVADPAAVTDNGLKLDVAHSSVIVRVLQSLAAIKKVAHDVGLDPRPVWRGILASAYPPKFVSDTMTMIEGQL